MTLWIKVCVSCVPSGVCKSYMYLLYSVAVSPRVLVQRSRVSVSLLSLALELRQIYTPKSLPLCYRCSASALAGVLGA